jgi:hypothetical protein
MTDRPGPTYDTHRWCYPCQIRAGIEDSSGGNDISQEEDALKSISGEQAGLSNLVKYPVVIPVKFAKDDINPCGRQR